MVLGTQSFKAREDASAALLNYGFTFFETVKVKSAGDVVLKPEVYKGEGEIASRWCRRATSGSRSDAARRAQLKTTATVKEPVVAPDQGGPGAGRAHRQSTARNVIARVPLVAQAAVPEGGWWTRMVDGISLWMK